MSNIISNLSYVSNLMNDTRLEKAAGTLEGKAIIQRDPNERNEPDGKSWGWIKASTKSCTWGGITSCNNRDWELSDCIAALQKIFWRGMVVMLNMNEQLLKLWGLTIHSKKTNSKSKALFIFLYHSRGLIWNILYGLGPFYTSQTGESPLEGQ